MRALSQAVQPVPQVLKLHQMEYVNQSASQINTEPLTDHVLIVLQTVISALLQDAQFVQQGSKSLLIQHVKKSVHRLNIVPLTSPA